MIPWFVNKDMLVIDMARPEKPRTPLAERLLEVRKALGYEARKALAEELGIHVETLGTYERGVSEPSVQFMATYRERFGVDLGWLLTGHGTMFVDPSKAPPTNTQPLDEMLMRSLAQIAIRAHKQANIVLRNEDIAVEAATLYNELKEKADDIHDGEEVKDLLPWLEGRLMRRLDKLKAAPAETTTKRA